MKFRVHITIGKVQIIGKEEPGTQEYHYQVEAGHAIEALQKIADSDPLAANKDLVELRVELVRDVFGI